MGQERLSFHTLWKQGLPTESVNNIILIRNDEIGATGSPIRRGLLPSKHPTELETKTMANDDLALMAHLMRRAGFGATHEELERRLEKGYEATVEEMLQPDEQDPVDIYEFLRYYHFQWKPGTAGGRGQTGWVWRMVNTDAPLQEKMCLFWHQIFATGVSKVDHYDEITDMIDLFREKGMGRYKDLLLEVSRNPAMLFWLDNHENHATAINENWGRELLELFTMGVGNYTEEDVYECSRAFTGWTMTPKLPRFHMGRWDWYFEFKADDHDNGEKSFLGHKGNFDGEDIIDIVLRSPPQPNSSRATCTAFLSRTRCRCPRGKSPLPEIRKRSRP